MLTEKEIFKFQTSSLLSTKKYLKECKNKEVNLNVSPLCDFVTWTNCLGLQKLLLLKSRKNISIGFIANLLKEIFAIGKNAEILKFSSKIKSQNKINIVYSYCSKENFSKNGLFYDTYFKQTSLYKKNTYWFLISLDNYIPKKTKNIFILYRKKSFFNFLYLFKFITKNIFKKNFIHNLNNTTNISRLYSQNFYKTFNKFRFNLYLPYENRPHQNAIINVAKKISRNNKVYGYYHRMPEPFQSEMIYKSKDLDKLFVCSKIQKEVFKKYFYWPENKVKIIPSIRYDKLKIRTNVIFIPYEIKDIDFYLSRLKFLLIKEKMSTKNITVSIHPLKRKHKDHISFKKKILKLLKENKILSKKNKNIPIILSEPGGVAAECLETVGQAFHITNSTFDIFSEKIWKNIKVLKQSDYIYKYVKLKKNNFININSQKNNFEKLLR
jgi:hypothetical protein|tara:strand:- start:337 stop:1650 length:1314 start_codon:yes stop_codon:yes gene_type:complete